MIKNSSNGIDAMSEFEPITVTNLKSGRPLTYDPVRLPEILAAVKRVYGALGQAAGLCRIPKNTFQEWIRYGDIDANLGKNSDFAALAVGVREIQAQCVEKLVKKGIKGKTMNGKFIQWLLSVIYRQEFGLDAAIIEALLARADKIEQSLNRMDSNTSQGVIEHDSEGQKGLDEGGG